MVNMGSVINQYQNRAEAVRHSFQQSRMAHWDAMARKMDRWTGWGEYYHHRLQEIYQFLIVPGQRVLEIGCGKGDLLAAVKPSIGVGVDFSGEMLTRARQRHPDLRFIHADAQDIHLEEEFEHRHSVRRGERSVGRAGDLRNDCHSVALFRSSNY